MRIAEIIPQGGYTLKIISEEGQIGFFDVEPYLQAEAFIPLSNKNEFNKIHNGKFFIEWDCGADLSADTIEAKMERKSRVSD